MGDRIVLYSETLKMFPCLRKFVSLGIFMLAQISQCMLASDNK